MPHQLMTVLRLFQNILKDEVKMKRSKTITTASCCDTTEVSYGTRDDSAGGVKILAWVLAPAKIFGQQMKFGE